MYYLFIGVRLTIGVSEMLFFHLNESSLCLLQKKSKILAGLVLLWILNSVIFLAFSILFCLASPSRSIPIYVSGILGACAEVGPPTPTYDSL